MLFTIINISACQRKAKRPTANQKSINTLQLLAAEQGNRIAFLDFLLFIFTWKNQR